MQELVNAQERTILAYEEMNRARRSYEASEEARLKAVQVGSLAFAMLGTSRAQIAELNRRIDFLESNSQSPDRVELEILNEKLLKASIQEVKLRERLQRAERDRDKFQQVADFAARRINALEQELDRVSTDGDTGESSATSGFGAIHSFVSEDQTFDDMDSAIEKIDSVLDAQNESVEDAADSIGWHVDTSTGEYPGNSQVYTTAHPYTDPYGDPYAYGYQPEPRQGPQGPGLDSAARVLSLAQQTADQAISEAREKANEIIREAQERAAKEAPPSNESSS